MSRSLSLRARVSIVSALAATIVIVAIGIAFAVFLRVNGSEQLDRALNSASVRPAESTEPAVTSVPATVVDDAAVAESLDGSPVRSRTVQVEGDPGMYLSVAIPEDPLTSAIRQQQIVVAAAAVAAIALAAGLGWMLAGRAVSPLQRLAAMTRTVGHGPDVVRPDVRGTREAEELSAAIGQMLDQIGAAQRRTEEALGTARDFASVSAHELRTPLTAMRTDLEVLATMPLTGEQRAEVVQDLLTTQRQVETTLADLERLAVGELFDPDVREEIDLVELTDRAVQESQRTHRATEITLTAPDHLTIRGIPAGLRLVLDNTIANAVRHGRAHHVAVTLDTVCDSADGHRDAVITVDDDGVGVPDAERTAVFGRFVRGAHSHPEGSGLGLALVAQQAELHGGTVELDDSPLGGARLRMRIPLTRPPG
ncbi:HAMP domain-containing sensor histidine kinase [Prescottella agglutinans]|uniref:histidine kinase n=1 Tax=Prescottella agglutinans TaxID=1644129 RepID=A0ABT6MIV2_9NOCA|nr:HAMP domain-containing sensor histidine kinase [Prescottella agglutinans]MDH6283269.1 two-component system sensor histidine kinase PrrB [Prescottella agglutinans]